MVNNFHFFSTIFLGCLFWALTEALNMKKYDILKNDKKREEKAENKNYFLRGMKL